MKDAVRSKGYMTMEANFMKLTHETATVKGENESLVAQVGGAQAETRCGDQGRNGERGHKLATRTPKHAHTPAHPGLHELLALGFPGLAHKAFQGPARPAEALFRAELVQVVALGPVIPCSREQ